jgi:replicative DNA helicase
MLGGNINLPSNKQILEMVLAEDKTDLITKEALKLMLTVELNEYDEKEFLLPKFNCWILLNKFNSGLSDIIEETRILEDEDDYEKVLEVVDKIKIKVDTMSNTNFIHDNEDDLGSDFDDAEKHVQDTSKFKVKTGIDSLDKMLGGGLDLSSLNTIFASAGCGKSLFMQNLAVNCADLGYNVVYISLEMSERKVMKRLGAMRLKIPINEYDNKSLDTEYMSKKLKNAKYIKSDNMFEKKESGKIFVKFWAAGTATTADFDRYIQKIQDKKGLKIHFIIIDYLTLIAPGNGGNSQSTLYTNGKIIAEGSRALGAKYECPILTAVQMSKEAWSTSGDKGAKMSDASESKAIPETSDTFWALNRKDDTYYLQNVKLRDGEYSGYTMTMDIDNVYLKLHNDKILEKSVSAPTKKK